MLDEAAVAADINRLQSQKHSGVDMDGLLLDLGRVVELKHAITAARCGSTVPVRAFSAVDIADLAQLARRQLRVAIDAVRRPPRSAEASVYACSFPGNCFLFCVAVDDGNRWSAWPRPTSGGIREPVILSVRHISFILTPSWPLLHCV